MKIIKSDIIQKVEISPNFTDSSTESNRYETIKIKNNLTFMKRI